VVPLGLLDEPPCLGGGEGLVERSESEKSLNTWA
jgi:hypothetical protein